MSDMTKTRQRIPAMPSTQPQLNEREQALLAYDKAWKNMVDNPSKATIEAFKEANKHFFEIEDAYRIGARLLAEHILAKLL